MSSFTRRLQRMGKGGSSIIISPGPTTEPTLYLSPATGDYTLGSTITMEIRLDSQSQEVNTYQANVSYPTALLQFGSTDTTGSPFITTIENTESSGVISLGAGILGGSTSGDQLVGTVTFTVLSAGAAVINFEDGSGIARASDSTDICQHLIGASYTIS